jgi:hypothetical protein
MLGVGLTYTHFFSPSNKRNDSNVGGAFMFRVNQNSTFRNYQTKLYPILQNLYWPTPYHTTFHRLSQPLQRKQSQRVIATPLLATSVCYVSNIHKLVLGTRSRENGDGGRGCNGWWPQRGSCTRAMFWSGAEVYKFGVHWRRGVWNGGVSVIELSL